MKAHESILIGADLHEAAKLAAEYVIGVLAAGNESKNVALSGGSTPTILYDTLTKSPYRNRVDWKAIEWFFSDERTVPPDHSDSNYRLANEHLLKPLGISAERIHRMPADAEDLQKSAQNYECLIRQLVPTDDSGVPALDLVLLGVGEDGHTASLFPGSVALAERDRLVVANQIPSSGVWRMTMTYPLLRSARHILFFVTGSRKAQVLERIFSPDTDPAELPAAGLRNVARQIAWVFDAEAARLVSGCKPE